MKKSELVVGVEYAVLNSPGAVRSWNGRRRSYRDKPTKATLIDVNFSERRMRSKRTNYRLMEEGLEAGIAVDTGSKVYRHGPVPQANADGTYKRKRGKVGYYDNPFVCKEEQFEYDYVILENAGCFISTWEEYEADEREAKEYERQREEKRIAEEKAASEGEKTVRATLKATLKRLRELAGPGAQLRQEMYEWRKEPDNPERTYVMVPTNDPEQDDLNTVGQPKMRALVTCEYLYHTGQDGERCMTGAKFKVMDDAMAQLLGVGVPV